MLPCRRYHPAEMNNRNSQFSAIHAAFVLRLKTRPSGLRTLGATSTFTFVAAWQLVIILSMIVSMGFRISVSLYPAILTTWLLTFATAGLTPAEHTSLRWTHNRACRFPDIRLKPFKSCLLATRLRSFQRQENAHTAFAFSTFLCPHPHWLPLRVTFPFGRDMGLPSSACVTLMG